MSMILFVFDYIPVAQILKVVSRKIVVSPSVDFAALAAQTAGYSGADLQAAVYNAHLDAVHEMLAEEQEQNHLVGEDEDVESSARSKSKGKEKALPDGEPETEVAQKEKTKPEQIEVPIEYVVFGGADADDEGGASNQRSREEEAKLQKKLRSALEAYTSHMGGVKKSTEAEKPKRQVVSSISSR